MDSSLVVCASAPGKLILFGEHAVVYGLPAVAAALSDLRIYVRITPNETKKVVVSMPDLPSPICASFASSALRMSSLHEPPTHEDAVAIQNVLRISSSSALGEMGVNAVTPVVYLLNRLAPEYLEEGLEINVRSKDLPVGAGLGSSAAFGVACTAALVRLSLLREEKKTALAIGKPPKEQIDRIKEFAFYSEILLHGTPSGIDNAVSAYGGAIVFTKDTENNSMSMENLNMPPLDMILTHTHVPRSTKALVADVRSMYNQHTDVVQGILDAIGAIAREFREMVLSGTVSEQGDALLTLVRTNQHLLRAVGVSHPSLDCICQVAEDMTAGKAASKLTGAGGGGCAMTLLRPGVDAALAQSILEALESQRHPWNYSCLTSSVGGDGVLWIPPESFEEARSSNPVPPKKQE